MPIKIYIEIASPLDAADREILAGIAVMGVTVINNAGRPPEAPPIDPDPEPPAEPVDPEGRVN